MGQNNAQYASYEIYECQFSTTLRLDSLVFFLSSSFCNFHTQKSTEDTEEAVSRKGSAVYDFMAYAEKKDVSNQILREKNSQKLNRKDRFTVT